MKNRKVMKRVLVIAIVAAIAGGSIGTGVYVLRMIILSLWKLRIRMKSKRCM